MLAGLALVCFVVQMPVSIVLAVAGPRGLRLESALAGVPFWWWITRGAWARANRGRLTTPQPVPSWEEPRLSTRRAWWYVWVAAACAVALAIALTSQAALGGWA
jgi:hypothetical protein